jgi:MFS transporter, SHS family, lactate transporter
MGWPTRETAHSGPSPACYLAERLLTEARGTASGFCYHSGAAVAGFVTPMASYFAVELTHGLCSADVDSHIGRLRERDLTLLVGPETKGNAFGAELMKF